MYAVPVWLYMYYIYYIYAEPYGILYYTHADICSVLLIYFVPRLQCFDGRSCW